MISLRKWDPGKLHYQECSMFEGQNKTSSLKKGAKKELIDQDFAQLKVMNLVASNHGRVQENQTLQTFFFEMASGESSTNDSLCHTYSKVLDYDHPRYNGNYTKKTVPQNALYSNFYTPVDHSTKSFHKQNGKSIELPLKDNQIPGSRCLRHDRARIYAHSRSSSTQRINGFPGGNSNSANHYQQTKSWKKSSTPANENSRLFILENTLQRKSLSAESLFVDKSLFSLKNVASPEPFAVLGLPMSPPCYSPSGEKSLCKILKFHCSWKIVTIALTLLTLGLSSAIGYFGANNSWDIHGISLQPSDSFIPGPCPDETMVGRAMIQAVLPENTNDDVGMSKEVTQLVTGRWYKVTIHPMKMWKAKLSVRQTSNFQFNVSLFSKNGSSLQKNFAIFGKEGRSATVTNYDWVHMATDTGKVISSTLLQKNPEVEASNVVTITKTMAIGDWYVSVFNDGISSCIARVFVTHLRRGDGSVCLNDCNARGVCDDGICRCDPWFGGLDCSRTACPVVCSNHGVYVDGKCRCSKGWKGPECDIHETECLVADCSGHGHCREGNCICEQGWTEEHCQKRDCLNGHCTDHGRCIDGSCVCDIGWTGIQCEEEVDSILKCLLPDCSGNGKFNIEAGKCLCEPNWIGRVCNKSVQ